MKRWVILLCTALLPAAALAQTAKPSASPVSDALRKIVADRSKILVAAAEEMPADKYSYRPTPQQMTFGHLVLHMAGSNFFLCSKISGTPAPAQEKLAETDPKDKLVAALKASFDYCTGALAKMDDSDLGTEMPFFGGHTISRAGAMFALADDFYDHYSAAAMYLRLNGLLPPTAQKKE